MRKGRYLNWRIGVAIRVGEAAFQLAADHRTELDARLPAGLIDGLGADVATLRGTSAGAKAARAGKRSATLTQNDAAREGNELAMSIRTAVRNGEPSDRAFQKAFGVGERVSSHKVASVEAALETILRAAEANPERTRAVGIFPEDLDEVRRVRAALSTADASQEVRTVSSKVATSDRDEAQRRVQRSVKRIVGAAAVAFRGRPELARLFADLIPSRGTQDEDAPASPSSGSADTKVA